MGYTLILSNAIMAFVFAIKFYRLPPQIPLLYSRPWGEAQITDWWFIFLIPLSMNLLYFLNIFLYKKFFAGNDFVKKIVAVLNPFLVISFTLIFIKIILLIT